MVTGEIFGAWSKSRMTVKPLSYTGPLTRFSHTESGLDRNSKYFVGFSCDTTNGELSGMTCNGTQIGPVSYASGSGSFRKSISVGTVTTGNGGLLTFQGTGATGVAGALQLFWIRIR